MTEERYNYYETPKWLDDLIGKRVVSADPNKYTLTLSDGTMMKFDDGNADCCSWIEVVNLSTTDHIITAATIEDTDQGDGAYKAWVQVITSDGPINIVEADADASNGYYLHGFAIGVTVTRPAIIAPTADEVSEAIQSILRRRYG